jgi:hypothetical protein
VITEASLASARTPRNHIFMGKRLVFVDSGPVPVQQEVLFQWERDTAPQRYIRQSLASMPVERPTNNRTRRGRMLVELCFSNGCVLQQCVSTATHHAHIHMNQWTSNTINSSCELTRVVCVYGMGMPRPKSTCMSSLIDVVLRQRLLKCCFTPRVGTRAFEFSCFCRAH